MKKSLILIALVTGCGASDQGDGNRSGNTAAGKLPPAPLSVSTSTLTGLYESGDAAAPSQLCVVEKGGAAHFGLVVWGANLSACSGAGEIEKTGNRLRLRMAGDQACTVEGRINGGRITLDAPVPAGCAYYCGARARFDGASFQKKGASVADAMKAKDPAGDPLCSS